MKYKYEVNKEELNRNTHERQQYLSKSRKLALLELRGNIGCEVCGYIKNIGALDFHHIKEADKSFPLDARNLSNRSWDYILKEFDKCQILCANCHREHHNEELYFSELLNSILPYKK